MRHHIAIRRPEYVHGGREKPEVTVFTQTHQTRHPDPWGRISLGDTVWMKWQSGPIVAKATVCGLRQMEDANPASLRETVQGSRLASLEEYWASLPQRFHAMAIWLQDEAWLGTPVTPASRSYGASWVALPDDDALKSWMVEKPATVSVPTKGRPSRTLAHSLRFQVFRRDGFTCRYCGRSAPEVRLHVDHVIAWSRGGTNQIENLVTACEPCNLGKGTQGL